MHDNAHLHGGITEKSLRWCEHGPVYIVGPKSPKAATKDHPEELEEDLTALKELISARGQSASQVPVLESRRSRRELRSIFLGPADPEGEDKPIRYLSSEPEYAFFAGMKSPSPEAYIDIVNGSGITGTIEAAVQPSVSVDCLLTCASVLTHLTSQLLFPHLRQETHE